MDDLILEPTKKTPGVDLSNGILLLHGNSIIANEKDFFGPLFSWVCAYLEHPMEITTLTLKLKYIDTPSVQALLQLMELLKQVEKQGYVFLVNWYYEYGDLEMLQLGVILLSRLEMEFDFNEFEPKNTGFN